MILTGKRGALSPAEAEKKPAIKHTTVEGSFACDHDGNEGLDHSQVGEKDMEPDDGSCKVLQDARGLETLQTLRTGHSVK
jgi:hypothetical protein